MLWLKTLCAQRLSGPVAGILLLGNLFLVQPEPTAAEIQVVRAHTHPNGISRGVLVNNQLAFEIKGANLQIFEVLRTGGIFPAGVHSAPKTINSVAVSGRYAFLGLASGGGIQVLDIQVPAKPLAKTNITVAASESVTDLVVLGNRLLYSGSFNGIRVADISNPLAPQSIAGYHASSSVSAMVAQGNLLFAVGQQDFTINLGLEVLDFSDPAEPIRIGGLHYLEYPDPQAIAVQQGKLFIADRLGLYIIDISDPAHPLLLGSFRTGRPALAVATRDEFAYVATGDDGLLILDASDPSDIRFHAGFGGPAVSVAIPEGHPDMFYLAGLQTGLHTLLLIPANPASVARNLNFDRNLTMIGNLGFTESSPIQIFDFSNPLAPAWVTNFPTGWAGEKLLTNGSVGYLLLHPFQITVLDLADPTHPRWIKSHSVASTVGAHDGEFFYSVGGGLAVYDIRDPLNFIEVASLNSPLVFGGEVRLSGNLLLVGSTSNVAIYDVSNPLEPRFLSFYDADSSIFSIESWKNFLYVGYTSGLLEVVDLSDPAQPKTVGSIQLDGEIRDMAVSRPYVYATTKFGGIEVIDMGYPDKPWRVGGHSGFVGDRVQMIGSYIAAFSSQTGLTLLNPFSPALQFDPLFNGLENGDFTAGLWTIYEDHSLNVTIQRSFDLVTWEDWRPLRVAIATHPFIDPETKTTPRAYFRAVAK